MMTIRSNQASFFVMGDIMGIYLEVSRKTHGRKFHRGSLDYNQKKSSNDLVDLQIYCDSNPII